MRGALIALLAMARAAIAQPMPDPPPPPDSPPPPAPDPYPDPLPPQEPVIEPPPQQPPQLLLTAEEATLLERGEIDGDKRIYGIAANVVIGFGLGQAIQGRWKESGWKFTLGQGGATVLFFVAAGQEGQNIGFELVAALSLLAFYGWGIVDAAAGPDRHNERIRDIKLRYGIPVYARIAPYMNRTHEGGTAGLTLRF